MSKLISDILDADRVAFRHLLEQWEAKSGRQGHDIRLYSDMRHKAVWAIKNLGLDPTDTISGELYFALQTRATADNEWLENYLKISKDDDPKKQLQKIIKWVTKYSKTLDVWVLKQSVIKTLLKKSPPKNTMKSLGLRSVDSMLKRNQASEILAIALEIETEDWKNKFHQAYKKFKISDFDTKKIDFSQLDSAKLDKLGKTEFNFSKIILPNYESGTLVLVCPKSRFPLDTLAILVSILESISDIRRYSAFYRATSVRKTFGQTIYDVSQRGIIGASADASEIGWNSIHRHLVGNEDFMAKIEQPYITYDEFFVEAGIKLLSGHDVRFDFWNDLEYVFFKDKNGHRVSMNLIDVVYNAANKLPFNQATGIYGKSRLWEELWARYLSHDDIAEGVISDFMTA